METIDRNRFRYVLSTVAPFNIPSLKDKFFLGFSGSSHLSMGL